MRIAIYARKSTESDDRQVQSLEDQVRALTDLARREGYLVAAVIQEARSAKAPFHRPEFDRLVRKIERGQVDGVLAWSIDRISRNPVDGGTIAYLLQTERLKFIRTPERTYRPEDNAMLFAIESAMATEYIKNLRRNVMRGMVSKAERGWHPGRPPAGYKVNVETREIDPDPERFPLVRRVFERAIGGISSIDALHKYAHEIGLTVGTKARGYKLISRSQIDLLLRNRFYMGELTFMGERYAGRHRPILTPEEFFLVQKWLRKIKWQRRPARPTFAFSGKFLCSRCGCRIIGSRVRKFYPRQNRHAEYVYYHCTGWKGCSRRGVTEENLRLHVLRELDQFQLPAVVYGWIRRHLASLLENEADTLKHPLNDMDSERDKANRRLNGLRNLRIDGEISAEEYAGAKAELHRRLDDLAYAAEEVKELNRNVLTIIQDKLDAAISAGELAGGDGDLHALGEAIHCLGDVSINLDEMKFTLDPVLAKMATLKPVVPSSRSLESGESDPSFLSWWTELQELITTATDSVRPNSCQVDIEKEG